MRYPNPDLLVYIGMADAYAAATEYLRLPGDQATLNRVLAFTGYERHPRHNEAPGAYTDDTEMSIANAHVLTRKTSSTPIDFADAYVAEFIRGGKRRGYAQGFYRLLCSVNDGRELLDKIRPDSTKNGAAMRAVPFGVIPDVDELFRLATRQASVTHQTIPGEFSARAVALMAHFALYGSAPLRELPQFCLDVLPRKDVRDFNVAFSAPWPNGQPVKESTYSVAEITVRAAVTAVSRHESLMEMLEWIIRCGGDTDTVAAIAWGIASCRYRDERLPEFLLRDLEGATYLRDVGAKLMRAYASKGK